MSTGENARSGSSPHGYAPADPRVDHSDIPRSSVTGDFAAPLDRDRLGAAETGTPVLSTQEIAQHSSTAGTQVHDGGATEEQATLRNLQSEAGTGAAERLTDDQNARVGGETSPSRRADLTKQAESKTVEQLKSELSASNVEFEPGAKKAELVKAWVKANAG